MIAAAIAGQSCSNDPGHAPAKTGQGDTARLQSDTSNTGHAGDSNMRGTAPPPPVTATYTGALPCADCAEISVTLTLLSDSSFQKKSLYMGRKAGSNETTDTGRWKMQGDTIRLTVKNGPNKYIKTDSGLVQLDQKGRRMTGKLAGKYVLKQTN